MRVADSEVCEDCRMKIHVRISADVLEDICTYLHAGDVRTCGNRDVDRYLRTCMHTHRRTGCVLLAVGCVCVLLALGCELLAVGFWPLAVDCRLLAVSCGLSASGCW